MKQRKLKFSLSKSPLTIYEHPEYDEKFIIGVDTSGGVGLDYTVASVLGCRIPFVQKAIWRSNLIRPAAAAEEIAKLGWYYNNAMMAVESNAMGAGLLSCLLDTHKYTRIYRKEEQLDADPNISDKFGWATTQTSKNLLITEFQQSLREKAIVLHDETTIKEFCNYVYLKKQDWNPNRILKTGAITGLYDDCVIATMLALHVARLYPQSPRPKSEPKLSGDVAQQRSMMKKFMDSIRAGPKQIGEVV